MKHSFIILTLPLLATLCLATPSPEVKDQLGQVQATIDTILTTAKLNPKTTETLIALINGLTSLAENSNQQEMNDLQAATHITCLFEGSSSFVKGILSTTPNPLITSFKYTARSNTLHKLVMCATQGKLTNEDIYTNPYTESLGYMCNEWICNNIFRAIFGIIAPQTLSATTQTISKTTKQSISVRIFAGIVAHWAWLLQKKLLANNAPALSKKVGITKRTV